MEKKLPPRRRMSQLDMADDMAAAAAAAVAVAMAASAGGSEQAPVSSEAPAVAEVSAAATVAAAAASAASVVPFKSPFERVEEESAKTQAVQQVEPVLSDRIYELLLKNVSRDVKMAPEELKVCVSSMSVVCYYIYLVC